jgi:nucleoside-diphosphate-sugar epimerase
MGDRYLVTGGAGFIGSHVIDELLSRGHEVRVLDNFSTGSRDNLAHVHGDIDLVEGDIQSYERVHNSARGVDYVIHLAALPLGTAIDCDFEPERIGDIKDSYADVSLARELLGYEPHVSLREGISIMNEALEAAVR